MKKERVWEGKERGKRPDPHRLLLWWSYPAHSHPASFLSCCKLLHDQLASLEVHSRLRRPSCPSFCPSLETVFICLGLVWPTTVSYRAPLSCTLGVLLQSATTEPASSSSNACRPLGLSIESALSDSPLSIISLSLPLEARNRLNRHRYAATFSFNTDVRPHTGLDACLSLPSNRSSVRTPFDPRSPRILSHVSLARQHLAFCLNSVTNSHKLFSTLVQPAQVKLHCLAIA